MRKKIKTAYHRKKKEEERYEPNQQLEIRRSERSYASIKEKRRQITSIALTQTRVHHRHQQRQYRHSFRVAHKKD